jgi:hypothetical protein
VIVRKRTLPNGTTRYEADAGLWHGKRVRKLCSTQAEAKLWLMAKRTERANHGTMAVTIPERDRLEWAEAREVLSPLGVGILEAARFYAARHAHTAPMPLEEAVATVVADKAAANARPRYVRTLRYILSRWATAMGPGRMVGEITAEDIRAWLAGAKHPTTRRNWYQGLSAFYSAAMKRCWIRESPLAQIDRPKIEHRAPGILKPAQVRGLLLAAAAHDPEMVAPLAVAVFAGLRPESELAAFRAMETSNTLQLLSLGFITDDEAALQLTGHLTPPGFKPLMGTGFYSSNAAGSTSSASRRLRAFLKVTVPAKLAYQPRSAQTLASSTSPLKQWNTTVEGAPTRSSVATLSACASRS